MSFGPTRSGLLPNVPGVASNYRVTAAIPPGQTHVIKYLKRLLDSIERGEIDPSFVITHRLPIEEALTNRTVHQGRAEATRVH